MLNSVQETNGHDESEIKMEDVDEPQSSIEYVPEQLEVKGAALEAFSDVFARFQPPPDSNSVSATHLDIPS